MAVRIRSRSTWLALLSAFVVATVNYASSPGTPLAGEILVHSGATASGQGSAAVARDADGDYVVVWQSDVSPTGDGTDLDIYFQRYSRDGTAQGAATLVNSTTAGLQQNAAVAMDAAGNFVVAWDSDQAETPAGSGRGIWLRRYDSSGVAATVAEEQVNTETASDQQAPTVAMDAAGNFVVAWQSLGQDGSGQGVYAQRFDNLGARSGTEFAVNTFTTSSQSAPSAAMAADGSFVIAWQSNGQEGPGLVNGIYAQRYLADGTPSGGELHVNENTAGEQRAPSAGLAAGGNYVVAWESPDAGGTGIMARIIDATDAPLTGELTVNTTTSGEQTGPVVAMDADGDFTVAWQGADASGTGVQFQRFNASGSAQGGETTANGTTTGTQQRPALGADADGDFVVVWESDHVGANGFDVYARRFAGPENVDLSISKADSPDPVVSGSTLQYTLRVTDNHADADTTGIAAVDDAIGSATGIVVTDTLPISGGMTFNNFSGTHADWTCSFSSPTVTCRYGPTLVAGATTGDIKINVTTGVTPGELTNTASVVADQDDTSTANNSVTQKTASCAVSANAGTVQLSTNAQAVNESVGDVTVTATRTGGLCGSITVNYATVNGTATAGSDYTARSGTLTWAENDNANKTFTVPVTADSLDEANETFTVTLSNPDRATLGATTTQTVTINDDDAVTVKFSAASQAPSESDGGVTVTVIRTGATTFDVSVPFTIGGSATSADHSAVSGAIAIPASANATENGTYVFTLTDDALNENAETVLFTMGTPTGGTVSGVAPTTHTVTIGDNDAIPTVNFNPVAATLVENDTGSQGVIVTAELDAVSGRDVTVPFTVSGTATDIGEHNASDGVITITAGNTIQTYTYFVSADTKFEDDETVVLTMGLPSNAVAGADSVHTTTITDDDNAPGVTLEMAPANGQMVEAAGAVTITARLDAVSGLPVTVHLAFDGSATLTGDYTRSATTITIPAGSTTGTMTLTAVQDTVDETNETVIVDIESVDNGTELMVQQLTTSIMDDDAAPNVTLTLTDSPFAENGGVATISATLATASEKATTITLGFGGSATVTDDYTRSGTTLVIPAGATTPTSPVTLSGVDDAVDEINETIVVDLSCDANCNEASQQQVTATITDDDSVTVSFAANQSRSENAGTVTVTATRTGASTLAITVPFTVGGTATNPADHNAANGNITIPASNNATEHGITTFTVTDDNVDEADQTVVFTMGTPTGGTVSAAAPTEHVVTIVDNDAVTVQFSGPSQTTAAESGSVTVTATRSGNTDFAITIPVAISGTAANPADHDAADGTITIPAASTSGSYVFNVVTDSRDEPTETVVLTMGTPSGGTVTTASPSVHTVDITDDDPTPTVQFAAVSQSAAEDVAGGTVSVTLQLSAVSNQDVQVGFATSGTAAHSTDYTLSPSAPGPVLIPAGELTATVTVTITNDPIDEPNETARLTLQSPVNATIGTNNQHTLTILDNDDTPQVSFTASAQTKAEAAGPAQIVVQLSRPSSEDVNVPFTLGGSANGADYTIDPSPATVIAGETTAVINVAITADDRDEVDTETLVVTMGTPTNATPTGTTVHTLSITDDDATSVAFAAAAQTVAEAAGVVSVTVTRSGASDLAVNVPVNVGGSATNPADHDAVAATVTIPASGNPTETATYAFNVVGDTVDELSETVVLSLGTPTGGTVTAAAPTTHTVTVTDDDTATVSIVPAASAIEGDDVSFGLSLSTASDRDVTVTYSTANGTAGSGDFTGATGATTTIMAGSTSGTIAVASTADALDESDETFGVTITAANNGALVSATASSATGTIVDDDSVTVDFAADQTVGESAGSVVVVATRTGPSAFAIEVPFTVSGTAANPDDHNALSGTITIPASTEASASASYTFDIQQDARDETNENLVFTMGTPTGGSVSPGKASHTVTITDDDAVTVSFAASQSVGEDAGTAAVTVTRSGASDFPVSVPFTVGGSAANPDDHDAVAGTLVVPASANTSESATYTFAVVDDALDEDVEAVVFTMGAPTGGTVTAAAPTTHTVTLVDDDAAPAVNLSLTGSPFAENGGTAIVTATLTAASGRDVTVALGFGGSAANPADYGASASSITISAGATTGSITLTGTDDAIDEPTETVVVSLGTLTNATPGSATSVTASIADDDAAPAVNLSLAGSPLAEAGGIATVTATLDAVSGRQVVVELAFGGSAGSTEYTASAGSIVIDAGAISGSVTLTGVDDVVDEADETVDVSLGNLTNATAGSTSSVTAIIADDDAAPTVSFGAGQSITEGTGGGTTAVSVTATLSAVSGRTVTVPFTVSGSASSATDHSAAAGSISIAAGTTSGTYSFTITRDSHDEGAETVVFTMGTPTNATAAAPTAHTVTITDDDAVTVAWQSAAQSVGEDIGAVTVTVVRNGTTDFSITVPVTVTGTAGSADHDAVSGSIVIPAAQTSASATFNILQDALDESTETIVGTLGTPTGGDVTAVAPTTHTVSIADDDATPTVSFDAAAVTATEGTGTSTTSVGVVASLSAPSGQTVTVPFTVGGTASSADHNAVSGSITIAAGATTGSYSFALTADALDEPDETVVFTMGTPVNAEATSPTAQTVTVSDDDAAPEVTVVGSPGAMTERGGTSSVIATLSAPSGRTITIPLTFGGQAESTDYTASATSILIPAGQLTGDIDLTAVDDTRDEPNESIVVDLSCDETCIEVGTQQAVVRITDNDATPSSGGGGGAFGLLGLGLWLPVWLRRRRAAA